MFPIHQYVGGNSDFSSLLLETPTYLFRNDSLKTYYNAHCISKDKIALIESSNELIGTIVLM